MRLLVWSAEPARALGRALAPHADIVEAPSWAALPALASEDVDVALVPTLQVLREPGDFELVPGVALVGEASPELALVVRGPMHDVCSVAFDPRYAQEALLSAILLREHYGAQPAFAAAVPGASLSERLAGNEAALASHDDLDMRAADTLVVDIGTEWLELTTRPFAWALLAARAGALGAGDLAPLGAAARAALPPDGWQFTLDGYGHAGLEEFAGHLFFHGALADLPALPGAGA